MKKILSVCRHDWRAHRQAFFLLGLILVVFLLRFPSLFEPAWYGDEGIYQVVGKAVREGRLLYQGIWDNKPPLLYLIYASVNGDLFSIKLVSLIAAIFALVIFFWLAKTLFKRKKAFYVPTIIFAVVLGLPLLEGNVANAENFMLPIIMLAALLIWKEQLKFNFQFSIFNFQFFWAGLLLALSFLIKTVAIFDLAALVLFLLFIYSWRKPKIAQDLKKLTVKLVPMFLGFLIPTTFTILFFLSQGILADFLRAAFVQTISYVSYGNQFLGPGGFLVFKLLILISFIVLLFWQRKLFSKRQLFIMLWLALSLFNAFFAQRPYTHYLLVLLPSFCLLIGEIIESKNYRFLGILLLLFVLSLMPRNFWIYVKIIPYYQNFLKLVTLKEDVETYQAFFDENVPKYYEAAQFIKMHTTADDKIFVWGDAAQVYVLSNKLPPGRLAVSYHITFYPGAMEETKQVLKKTQPKYIVSLWPEGTDIGLLRHYSLRFVLSKGALIYEREL